MNRKNFALVGRTVSGFKFNYEKFSSKEYSKIFEAVKRFVLQSQINSLPVDVVGLVLQNGWQVCPYSQGKDIIKDINEDLLITDWGFTILSNGKYIIFYDDGIKIESQRFTIAHECGHIVLNHFKNPDILKQEKAADIFAAELLMPLGVLKACNVETIKSIENLCGVSFSAACYRFEVLQKFEKDEDDKIQKHYENFIKKYLERF